MSSSTFLLPGNASYWTATGATLANFGNVSFTFEFDRARPKGAIVTLVGSTTTPPAYTPTASGTNVVIQCAIPYASLPSWFRPSPVLGTVGVAGNGRFAVTSQITGALDNSVIVASNNLVFQLITLSTGTTAIQLVVGGTVMYGRQ